MVSVTPNYQPPPREIANQCRRIEAQIQKLAQGQEAQAQRLSDELDRLDPGGPRSCLTSAVLSLLKRG